MASAWVACKACRVLVTFGKEHYRDGKAFCTKCYDEGREEETAKRISKMEKSSGIKISEQKPRKPRASSPEKCDTCSGSEVRCSSCGGLLCRPVSGEECEQRKHGRICLDCFENTMGVKK